MNKNQTPLTYYFEIVETPLTLYIVGRARLGKLLPAVQIVDFDSKAAYACGTFRARLEKQDEPLALADLEEAYLNSIHSARLVLA